MSEASEYTSVECYHIGRRLNEKGRLGYEYYIPETRSITRVKTTLLSGVPVGTLLQIHRRPDGSISMSPALGPKVIAPPDDCDPTDRLNWQVADRAAQEAYQQRLVANRQAPGPLATVIEELRGAFLKLPYPQRTAFLIWLNRQIRE